MCHYLGGGLHGRQKRVKAQSESSKSVVNSVLISREMPVFPGFLEIIRVVLQKIKTGTVEDSSSHSTRFFDAIEGELLRSRHREGNLRRTGHGIGGQHRDGRRFDAQGREGAFIAAFGRESEGQRTVPSSAPSIEKTITFTASAGTSVAMTNFSPVALMVMLTSFTVSPVLL